LGRKFKDSFEGVDEDEVENRMGNLEVGLEFSGNLEVSLFGLEFSGY